MVQMLAGVKTLCYLEHMFNGICFNEEPWLTSSSVALDLVFRVGEVAQHLPALCFGLLSWQWSQTRMIKDGVQPSINSVPGFPSLPLYQLVVL